MKQNYNMINQADMHTRAVQAWLSSRSPDAVSFSGVGVEVNSTGLPIPLLNLALSKGYPKGVSETEIDAEVIRIKKFFENRNAPWYWWVGPNPKPSNMKEHLKKHGLVCDRAPLPALIAQLPGKNVAYDSKIKVWEAKEEKDLKIASTIRRIAFRFPEGTALSYFEDMESDWLRGDPAKLYLAQIGTGPPAAIGALIKGAGLPGVYVMATLPEWKRKGLGKAILSIILSEATKEGYSNIVLTASRFGYPLYQQFGFEEIF
ncbi:MAG: N-acetyltransferase, partial [Chloroflexi bacterium]